MIGPATPCSTVCPTATCEPCGRRLCRAAPPATQFPPAPPRDRDIRLAVRCHPKCCQATALLRHEVRAKGAQRRQGRTQRRHAYSIEKGLADSSHASCTLRTIRQSMKKIPGGPLSLWSEHRFRRDWRSWIDGADATSGMTQEVWARRVGVFTPTEFAL